MLKVNFPCLIWAYTLPKERQKTKSRSILTCTKKYLINDHTTLQGCGTNKDSVWWHMRAQLSVRNDISKADSKEEGQKMNLLKLKIWSNRSAHIAVTIPVVDSDCWSDEGRKQRFREKVERKEGIEV